MDFASGYVQRSLHLLPKQGSRAPWRLRQNYLRDVLTIRRGPVEDKALQFSTSPSTRDSVKPDPGLSSRRAGG
jgi:monooxygenase